MIDVTGAPSAPDTPLALVLAAGAGSRMGGPKLFARVRGAAFSVHIGRALDGLGWRTVWVLRAPQQADELAALLGRPPVFCVNPDPGGDMLSSVVTGLRAPAARLARVLCVWPVDFPLVSAETLTRLADGMGQVDAVLPAHQGRTGNPLIVRRHVLCRWLSVMPHDGLRQAMREHPVRLNLVEVPDDGPLRNLNTTADCLTAEDRPE